MLTKEQNQALTDCAPGTPAGELLRRYWQPIALSEEVEPHRPIAVRALHEDFVLFRDGAGTVGLLERSCCHRGMDLTFGRVESGGIRCVYHGWLFAPNGQCLEQPGEPEGSTYYQRVRQPAYPVREVAGAVFAYFGPGEPPELPSLEIFAAAREHVFAQKFMQECNYLQGNEGNLDPVHQSFLHGFRGPASVAETIRRTESIGGTEATNLELYAANTRPQIDLEDTAFGIHAFITRLAPDGGTFLKIYNFVMPNLSIVPGGGGSDGYGVHWHVPIDAENHWKFIFTFSRSRPISQEHRDILQVELEAPFLPKRNRRNNYLQDRDDMISGASGWYSGFGTVFGDHDTAAQEAQGAIADRTKEHLAESDKIIARLRKLMFEGFDDIKVGKDPRGVVRAGDNDWGHELACASEYFAKDQDWRALWNIRLAERLSEASGR